jgi:hypothetical protein
MEPPRHVADFLDLNMARWDEEKLRQHMLPPPKQAFAPLY